MMAGAPLGVEAGAPSRTLAVSPLKLAQRGAKDMVFGVVYVLIFFATIGIMIYCSSTAQTTLQAITDQCTQPTTSTGRAVRAALVGADDDESMPDMIKAAPYLGASFAFSVLFGILWMVLLRYYAKPVVYGTLIIKGVLLIGLGVYLSQQGRAACGLTTGDCTAASMPLILCAFGALYFLWLFCARRRIELTAKLLEQSIVVVSTHPGLFLVSAVLLLVTALSLVISIGGFIFLVLSQLTVTPVAGQPGQCDYAWVSTTTDEVMYGVLTVFFYWSVWLWLFVRFYIVSLTTGIWYYENESLAAQEGSLADKEYTRAPICTSVSMALTKGFGTIAFCSLIVTLCEAMKRAARKSSSNNGLIGLLVACCIMCFINCIEFLTRFALTYSALTGDGLCESGRTFLDSCTRHGFLKVVVVDYLASITLNFGALVFGLAVAAITVGMVDQAVLVGPAHNDDRAAVLYTVGGAAWLIATIVLVFIASLLLNIVDASYACVVLDLDNHARVGTFFRPQIAQAVLVKVKPDFVVMQPAGGAAYASSAIPVAQPVAVPVGQPVHHASP